MAFSMIPMMAAMSGFNQFQKMLKEKGQLATDNLDKKLGDLALEVEIKATDYAPHKTGYLKSKFRTKRVRKYYWLVSNNARYAPYQEFGSIKNKPHPFMRPAIMAIRGDLHRLLARADLLKG